MSCRAGKKLFQWSRVKSSTEEIVKQLTVPLREHAEPILTLTPEQKREAVRLKIQEVFLNILCK